MATTYAEICIVGLGPRGLSVLERLCANAPDCVPDGHDVVLHIVDPYLAHGSRVWRTAQSAALLMNTVTSQVTMYVDESVQCDGPVVPGPSLYEWAQFNALVGPLDDMPAHLLAEARRLGPNDYPSRAFYGQYLTWVLDHLVQTAPNNVRIVRHALQAVDLVDGTDGRQTVLLADGEQLTGLHAVVLAQGHTPGGMFDADVMQGTNARARGLLYLAPRNPADVDLSVIEPGRPVLLRGLGLNFFDYMALLTLGRGGRFGRAGNGKLVYHPSGREPLMAASSRRGVPYHARGENQKGAFGRHEPLFLTTSVIADLRARADAGHPADLRTDVWPMVDSEVRAVYYSTLITGRQCTCDAKTFLRQYVALRSEPRPWQGRPFDYTATPAEDALLDKCGIGRADRWDWHRVARPYQDRSFANPAGFRSWMLGYLARDVEESRLGNVHGALKAALDVLRDLRNEIRLVVDHGGLSGDSYRDDLQGWYTPFNAFVSIGPPPERIEQLIALIEAGVLDILGPSIAVELTADHFVASSPRVPGSEFRATALIEARLPEPDIRTSTDPLIRALSRRGECGGHRIAIRGGGYYDTGGLAVSRSPYRLLDAEGGRHPRRFAFGVPTETVHWVTAAGIRPGVNSVILGDADAIARATYATVPAQELSLSARN
ncbi:FAD/NAD(P)-binding protein [Actinocrispum wychmicini]|uniref:FAD-NAD(P)-binding protein n=1 Tax=Actinocrispum wychmicini TaxID=1213861 RepID=A0A4R2JR90_9PSEU|nr:FAD/NAD(P)-binding protein [Actinocrispum wychmicini]TCO62004.1 FAD-NAD(P)-binding protein [Actinocrispum wychmicini]